VIALIGLFDHVRTYKQACHLPEFLGRIRGNFACPLTVIAMFGIPGFISWVAASDNGLATRAQAIVQHELAIQLRRKLLAHKDPTSTADVFDLATCADLIRRHIALFNEKCQENEAELLVSMQTEPIIKAFFLDNMHLFGPYGTLMLAVFDSGCAEAICERVFFSMKGVLTALTMATSEELTDDKMMLRFAGHGAEAVELDASLPGLNQFLNINGRWAGLRELLDMCVRSVEAGHHLSVSGNIKALKVLGESNEANPQEEYESEEEGDDLDDAEAGW
jgi:hypothetical protein